jgi:molecular chaperone DnaK (HSP70)
MHRRKSDAERGSGRSCCVEVEISTPRARTRIVCESAARKEVGIQTDVGLQENRELRSKEIRGKNSEHEKEHWNAGEQTLETYTPHVSWEELEQNLRVSMEEELQHYRENVRREYETNLAELQTHYAKALEKLNDKKKEEE